MACLAALSGWRNLFKVLGFTAMFDDVSPVIAFCFRLCRVMKWWSPELKRKSLIRFPVIRGSAMWRLKTTFQAAEESQVWDWKWRSSVSCCCRRRHHLFLSGCFLIFFSLRISVHYSPQSFFFFLDSVNLLNNGISFPCFSYFHNDNT